MAPPAELHARPMPGKQHAARRARYRACLRAAYGSRGKGQWVREGALGVDRGTRKLMREGSEDIPPRVWSTLFAAAQERAATCEEARQLVAAIARDCPEAVITRPLP